MEQTAEIEEILKKYSISEEPEPEALIELILRLHSESVKAIDDATKLTWLLARSNFDTGRLQEVLVLLRRTESARFAIELGKLAVGLAEQTPVNLLVDVIKTTENESARIAAIHALGSSSFEETGPLLISVAGDPSESQAVRGHAIEALANIGDSRAVNPLIELARENKVQPPKVAFWIAYALGELRSTAAIPALESLARDTRVGEFEKSVADEARESLDILGGLSSEGQSHV